MQSRTPTSERFQVRFTIGYLLVAAFRIAAVTMFLFAPYVLLVDAGNPSTEYFRLYEGYDESLWGVLLGSLRGLAAGAIRNLPMAAPFVIVATIAECQIVLLRGVGFTASTVHVLLPAALACVGGYFGYLQFVDQMGAVGPAARAFIFGSGLLFFLAASFQVWSWHRSVASDPGESPVLWYAMLLCIAGIFFGSCIAANAPSPYLREVLDYRRQAWSDDRSPPGGDWRPVEESPGY